VNTYKVSSKIRAGWDMHLGFAVRAESVAQARMVVQAIFAPDADDPEGPDWAARERDRWNDDNIVVERVTEPGIFLASYRNG
jgi:hypothetical protein